MVESNEDKVRKNIISFLTSNDARLIDRETFASQLYQACASNSPDINELGWLALYKFLSTYHYQYLSRDPSNNEDAIQLAWIKIHSNLSRIVTPAAFLAYAQMVVRSVHIDLVRKYSRQYDSESFELLRDAGVFDLGYTYTDGRRSSAPFDDGGIGSIENNLQLEELFKDLSPVQKYIFNERIANNTRLSLLSDELGLSKSQIKYLYQKAKKQIESLLGEQITTTLPKESKFKIYIYYGSKAERSEKWKDGIRYYEKALTTIGTEYLPSQHEVESAKVKFRKAVCLKKVGRWSEALEIHSNITKVFSDTSQCYWKAESYFQMSELYQMMNIYEPALMYYREAYYQYLRATNKKENELNPVSATRGMAKAQRYLGELEFQLDLLQESLLHLTEAKRLFESLKDYESIASVNMMISNLQSALHRSMERL